jgi:hypothetical protein
MTRYFPELVAAVTAELPERCVIDSVIVVATDHGLDAQLDHPVSLSLSKIVPGLSRS